MLLERDDIVSSSLLLLVVLLLLLLPLLLLFAVVVVEILFESCCWCWLFILSLEYYCLGVFNVAVSVVVNNVAVTDGTSAGVVLIVVTSIASSFVL